MTSTYAATFSAWIADKADGPLIPALLLVAVFKKCDDQGLGLQFGTLSCPPPPQDLVADNLPIAFPLAWTSSDDILSTSVDFLISVLMLLTLLHEGLSGSHCRIQEILVVRSLMAL